MGCYRFSSLTESWCVVLFPATHPHPQVSTAFQICPSLVEQRFPRDLLSLPVPGHTVQASCHEVSELVIGHPLSRALECVSCWPAGQQ